MDNTYHILIYSALEEKVIPSAISENIVGDYFNSIDSINNEVLKLSDHILTNITSYYDCGPVKKNSVNFSQHIKDKEGASRGIRYLVLCKESIKFDAIYVEAALPLRSLYVHDSAIIIIPFILCCGEK